MIDQTKSGHRRWRVWVLVLVIFIFCGFFFEHLTTGQSNKAGIPQSPPPLPIRAITVQIGDIEVDLNALGSVTPLNTVTVKSRVDGQLMNINYREGSNVQKGKLLAEIDPRPFQAQLDQAEGQLQRDQAFLDNALIDLDRYKTAYQRNAIPKQQLDTQEATVRQYEGAVKLDRGQIETAKLQLTYCRINSPIEGRVGLSLVDPGNIVHAADTNGLLVITQLQPITVIFSVAEDYLPQIQQQLRLGHELVVDAFDRAQQRKIASGTVLALDNQIDSNTGTVKLEAIFPNQDDSLFPNQFVNVRLLIDTQHGATLIPTATIQRNAQGAFVYLVKPDQTVAMQSISAGTTHGDVSAVTGLKPGNIIAADGFDKLQDGAKVVVREEAAASNKGGGQ